MTHEVTITKGQRTGWKALTKIALCKVAPGSEPLHREGGTRVLRIETGKASRGGIYTTATVILERDGMMTWAIGSDYHKRLAQSPARCTERSVSDLHNEALKLADAVIAEARAYYEAQAAERERRAA